MNFEKFGRVRHQDFVFFMARSDCSSYGRKEEIHTKENRVHEVYGDGYDEPRDEAVF